MTLVSLFGLAACVAVSLEMTGTAAVLGAVALCLAGHVT
ncbi:hypothetical protein ACVIYL_000037 [Bradyrhizobium sp. USDA 3315]